MSDFDEWACKQSIAERLARGNCCKKAFEAGVASQQVEIDELKQEAMREREQATEYFADCEYLKAERDTLQKRIDEAIALMRGQSIGEVFKAIRILKGGEQADASE